MVPDADLIENVTRGVWSEMLNRVSLERTDAVCPPDAMRVGVEIRGSFNGVVVLEIPSALAKQMAADWYQQPVAQTTDQEAKEVLFELTNQIGGNMKGCLEGEHRLSLPHDAQPLAKEPLSRVAFDDAGVAFSVSVTEG